MLFLFFALALAEPPEYVDAWRSTVSWETTETEVSQWLSGFIQVDTVNPEGNEINGIEYLERLLYAEDIPYHRVVHSARRASLIARIESHSDAPPLCLLSHVDVVPSELDKWTFPPLSGEIRDGYVWGRGALDMKGFGIVQFATMALLRRLGVPLERDVILLAVADEEIDNLGARTLVDEHWDNIGCGHLINEGGIGLIDGLFDGQDLHAISVAEKGTLWVRLIAEGTSGHGSTIKPIEAPTRLREAMNRVAQRYKTDWVIHPGFRELLRRAGSQRGGFTKAVLNSTLLTDLLVKPKLKKLPATAATLANQVHLTGMGGASSINVVPGEAWAQYDCRLRPGTSPEDLLETLNELIKDLDGLRWEVQHQEAGNESTWDDEFFRTIAKYAIEDRPHSVAGPILSPGFTDSIFFRPKGVVAYGYAPFLVTQAEAQTMHGHDEKVSTENLREGTRRLFSMVVDFAGTGEGPLPALSAIAASLDAIPRSSTPDEWAVEAELRLITQRAAAPRELHYVQSANSARLREWLSTTGWLGDTGLELLLEVGSAELQQRALQGLPVDTDPWARIAYARLTDRLLVDNQQPQVFGTIGGCTDGAWSPSLRSPEKTDARRAEVNLPALPLCE